MTHIAAIVLILGLCLPQALLAGEVLQAGEIDSSWSAARSQRTIIRCCYTAILSELSYASCKAREQARDWRYH